jgi:hypothetical protein
MNNRQHAGSRGSLNRLAFGNALMLLIPGAMDAGVGQLRFWWSLALSLLVAGAAAFPVVRLLIARGRGHAVVHSTIERSNHDEAPAAGRSSQYHQSHHPGRSSDSMRDAGGNIRVKPGAARPEEVGT